MLTCKTCGEAIAMSGIHRCPGFQNPTPDPLRAALVAIQELHPVEETGVEGHGVKEVWCPTCQDHAPCPTRRLADDALGGDSNG